MTTSPSPTPRRPARLGSSPLADLVSHLRVRSAGRAGRLALERWKALGVPTTGCPDPFALARSCHGTGEPTRSAAIVASLSGLVPGDEVAGLCVLVALTPALAAMVRWLARTAAERPAAEQAVLSACWSAVSAPGAHSARALVKVTWAILRDEVRAEARHKRAEPCPTPPLPAGPDDVSAERLATLLTEARRSGALSGPQAELLFACYVEDRTSKEICAASGRSPGAVKKARQRAERALADFATEKAQR